MCLQLLQYLFLEQANKLPLKYSTKRMTWNRKIISLWWGEFLLRYFNNSVLQCSHPQLICKTDNNNRQARLVALRISCISPAVHLSTSEKRCRIWKFSAQSDHYQVDNALGLPHVSQGNRDHVLIFRSQGVWDIWGNFGCKLSCRSMVVDSKTSCTSYPLKIHPLIDWGNSW